LNKRRHRLLVTAFGKPELGCQANSARKRDPAVLSFGEAVWKFGHRSHQAPSDVCCCLSELTRVGGALETAGADTARCSCQIQHRDMNRDMPATADLWAKESKSVRTPHEIREPVQNLQLNRCVKCRHRLNTAA